MVLRVQVREVEFSRMPLAFVKPFRFGAYALDACPQVFTHVVVEVEGHGFGPGIAAELAVPRWFDKRPEAEPRQNIADLCEALGIASRAYLDAGEPLSVAQLHQVVGAHLSSRAAHLPALVRSFGLAQLEKAVMDAVCRMTRRNFAEATRADWWGVASSLLCSDIHVNRVSSLLASLQPCSRIALRHTVGYPVDDDPEIATKALIKLREEVVSQGIRYLKIKLSGTVSNDAARVAQICSAFVGHDLPSFSLDCNEQYREGHELLELCARLGETSQLGGGVLAARCLYIEQPFARDAALRHEPLPSALPVPVIIDEADDADDAFPRAMRYGYRGVSSKACKGVLRSIGNIVRCADRKHADKTDVFVAPEDLCTQPGWALQQDLALAALTGSAHVEKNGHQYVQPFTGLSPEVCRQFLQHHEDLYQVTGGAPSVRIVRGDLRLESTNMAFGFGTAVLPDFPRSGLGES